MNKTLNFHFPLLKYDIYVLSVEIMMLKEGAGKLFFLLPICQLEGGGHELRVFFPDFASLGLDRS